MFIRQKDIIRYSNELYHYGVKGMKWGVRRSKDELKYNRNSIIASVNNRLINVKTKNDIPVKQISSHAADRASNRKVTSDDIIDALKNPLNINDVRIDGLEEKPKDL